MKANTLDGKSWTRNSVSIWSDLKLTPEERRLDHPSKFPVSLVERLIDCLVPPVSGQRVVLDPFAGSGSSLVAARKKGCRAIGFELSPVYANLCRERLKGDPPAEWTVAEGDAWELAEHLPPDSLDLIVSSPPYWNVMERKRSADGKPTRDYNRGVDASSNGHGDLSLAASYPQYLEQVASIYLTCIWALKPGRYCVVNVQDLRVGPKLYPLHSDLTNLLANPGGYEYSDLIIWDRRADYNSLRPLGYPHRWIVNKVHDYLLLFRRAP
jgi:DNA modification methylase